MIQFLSEMLMYSYLSQKIKRRCKLEDYSEHSDQREDGDENLVACSAGNSLGSEYLDGLLHFYLHCFYSSAL